MKKIKKTGVFKLLAISLVILFQLFIVIHFVNAAYTYTPMENIPGFESQMSDFPNYFLSITKFAIWTVAIAAMLMVTIGGFMYMTAAGNNSRMDTAKRVIFDALFGLIVVLFSWVFLYVINPDLVKVDLTLAPIGKPEALTVPVAKNPTATPPTGGSSGSCNGIPTSGINASQCGNVTAPLGNLLNCMRGKGVSNLTITSISDNTGFDTCKNSYSRPPCAHAKGSCHYGGSCGDGSYAADFSTRNSNKTDIISAANACGANAVFDESNHIHASVGKNCGCQ
jgi:hypothetical protein